MTEDPLSMKFYNPKIGRLIEITVAADDDSQPHSAKCLACGAVFAGTHDEIHEWATTHACGYFALPLDPRPRTED